MRKRRFIAAAAFLLAVAVVAAGCGSKATGGTPSQSPSAVATNVSGTVSVMAVWSGAEQKAFQQVINAFNQQYPNVTVKFTSAGDQLPTVLSTAVQGGNPPSLAVVPQPGLMKQFAQRGVLQPLDFARSIIAANHAPDWIKLTTVNGHIYGLVFKGANKSTVWYNVQAFKNAGITPPTDWTQLLQDAKTLKASGVKAYSIGADVGWPLTDLFENIYLRTAGPDMYDKLTAHQIPWTDPSVTTALNDMAQVLGDTGNIAGGTSGALQTDFPTSVTNVYANPPKAGMVFEGDFVEGVITSSTSAQPGTGFNFFAFPTVNGAGKGYVVGGGDTVVMFKDTPATRAFVDYLATPQAAEVWAKIGGFSSPNENVPASVYSDPIAREAAVQLANATTFRFDMSDQAPAAFGGTPGQGEWKLMTDFLANPANVHGIQVQLEAAAKKAYGQ
jgi:ABC-type glycerol-3-phosphate transport system substrate-binding protein